ncbi:carboxypeptidase-like regulatory domain-containing protein [Sphingobacterium sp. SG20118]|uniref:STN domain-containing protein n=1 Tax=Sphingobacterium sp. SG20118 TaxID=3367156 RepID=UPI0037DFC43E
MKLSLAIPLLLATSLQVNALTYGQHVTLDKRNVKLSVVLNDIQKQSGYNIFYNEGLFSSQKRIDVKYKNMPFKQVLEEILIEEQLDFSIVDKNIILRKIPFSSTINVVNVILQKGRVVDQLGKPLVGVSVTIKGKSQGTLTNELGEFSIEVAKDDILQFKYIGFSNAEQKVSGN